MILHNPHIQPQYKGYHYYYDKDTDRWYIYDNYYTGNLMMFNASLYRIDQAFDFFFREISK
jgi:hypothetical protein